MRALIDYGSIQLANRLGLAEWQFEAARQRGLVPDPDRGRRWSAEVAEQLAGRVDEIVEVVGAELPIGAHKAAARLAERTGLEVERADVEELVERDLLATVGQYKGWPLYDPRQLDALDRDHLVNVVAARQTWLASSLDRPAAAERLGWRWAEFDRVIHDLEVQPGRFGRYAVSDIDALAGDEELAERIQADRLLGPDEASARLEIRRTDFEYCLAAGWIEPETHISVRVGRRRRIAVSLYRTADVDRLLELPGVDWEAVRACRPGELSPLREHARLPATRARIVHAFCRELAARWDVDVWTFYDGSSDQWEFDWARNGEGQPDRDELERAVAAHPGTARHRQSLVLGTEVGRTIRWARAMLEPGAAVILDTETTDLPGPICELAVIDTTGEVLLDTLVDPGQAIAPDATWVHGITDADVSGAPSWTEVLPRLLDATRGRKILAYNADFDRQVVLADTSRLGLEPGHLADGDRWSCLMHARGLRERAWGRLALYGPHRALGDCRAALEVLLGIAAGHAGSREGGRR
jgi:hypothetical protein